MRDSRGTHYTLDDGGVLNRFLRADARALARAQSHQSRGALQIFPTLATDLLPDWEQRLGITPDTSQTRRARASLLEAVLAGNGPPTEERLSAALSIALADETVVVTATVADAKVFDPTFTIGLSGFSVTYGNLRPGTHYISVAFENDTGHISAQTNPAFVDLSGAFVGIHLDSVAIAPGYTKVHYYLSVEPGSTSLAHVATGTGSPVELTDYPTTDRTSAVYHYLVTVSYATWLDQIKRNRIHTVIGPMIEAWSTYDIVTGSPFLLDISPLDAGAL